MRWNVFFLVFCVFFIVLCFNAAAEINSQITGKSVTGEVVTGETVSGKATSQILSWNISVIAIPPTLTIKKPSNKTYFSMLDFRIEIETNANSAWYNFNNGNNQTFSSSDYNKYYNFSVEGSNTIYVFASNGQGITLRNITFYVNISMFNMTYSKYTGSYKGNSTNFNEFPYEDIQNYSNLTLEHVSYGRIFFNEPVNLTEDYNPNDNFIDIDSYINISSNRIFLDSAMLPNFNKSATLVFYNLAFTNPRILMDGQVCSAAICKTNDYTNGVLSFNVSHFTTYLTEETPASTTTSGGGGGVECISKWNCRNWSKCTNHRQNRTCGDLNRCGSSFGKPSEIGFCNSLPVIEQYMPGEQNLNLSLGTTEFRVITSDVDDNITIISWFVNGTRVKYGAEKNSSYNFTTFSLGNYLLDVVVSDGFDDTFFSWKIDVTDLNCVDVWNCGNWSKCINGSKYRECMELNNCSLDSKKPSIVWNDLTCIHCFDNVQNYDEERVDCGGECVECVFSSEKPLKIRFTEFEKLVLISAVVAIVFLTIVLILYWLRIAKKTK